MFTSWKYLKGLFSEKRTTRTCFSIPTLFNLELYLVAAVTMLRQRGITISDESERDVMVLRQALERAQQLDPAAFEAARAEGQQMTMEQALALATENASQDAQLPGSGLGPSSE